MDCLDQSLVALGIDTVVVGIVRNVDPQASCPFFSLKRRKSLNNGLQCQIEEAGIPVIKGYTDLLQSRA